MCGIIAVNGSREAAPLLLEGLRQLEYRGYDSAGIATVNAERQLSHLRAVGKLVNLTAQGLLEVCPGSPGWVITPTVMCAGTAPAPWPPSPPPRLLLQAI